jgi:hypothetical protein
MPRRSKRDPLYRPYDPTFHPQDLVEKMSKGLLNVEIASEWNVCEDTFKVWRKEHEELEQAYKLGLVKYEAWFIQNVFKPMIEGKLEGKHAFNSAIAIANNKLGWSRGNGQEKAGTQININQMNVLSNKSTKELEESIKADLAYLTSTKVIDIDPIGIEHDPESDE